MSHVNWRPAARCTNRRLLPPAGAANDIKLHTKRKEEKRRKFKSGPQVRRPVACAGRTCSAPPFPSAVAAAWLSCKCAITWEKKNSPADISSLFSLFFFLFPPPAELWRFNHSEVSGKVPRPVAHTDDVHEAANEPCSHLLLRLLSVALSLFCRAWLPALLHSHFPAQHGAGRESAWELIWRRRKGTKLGGKGRTSLGGRRRMAEARREADKLQRGVCFLPVLFTNVSIIASKRWKVSK